MQLPESLQIWHDWLSWFGDDVAEDLGTLVLRLAPWVGRFRGAKFGDVTEPDGLGDLHRRGSYERLLSSEWLLAEEVPDEFIRRAATGEHLFLAPRPRATQGQKLILALFDAGPLQLGAPRLVQVALWILLARRARELGGAITWGVLQDAPALFTTDRPEDLRRLLRARSFSPVEVSHAEAWQAFLTQQAVSPGEFWLVSPDHRLVDARLTGVTHQMRALPDLTGEGVEVHLREGRNLRQGVLVLPPVKSATRILKGEFQAGDQPRATPWHASKIRLSITHPPVLMFNGSHVAVSMLQDVGAVVFQIPRKPVHHPGKPRQQRWANGYKPLALTGSDRTLLALLSGQESLLFHQFDGRGSFPRPPREQFDAPPGQATYLPSAYIETPHGFRFFVLDRAGQLKYWQRRQSADQTDGQMEELASHVLALAQISRDAIVFVSQQAGELVISRLGRQGVSGRVNTLKHPKPAAEVLLGAGKLWVDGFGGCAVRLGTDSAQAWQIYERNPDNKAQFRTYELSLPEGWHGIGLIQLDNSLACSLVVINKSRDQIHLFSEARKDMVHSGAAWITRFTVCPVSGVMALLTNAYQLQVYDLRTRELRVNIDARGEPDAA